MVRGAMLLALMVILGGCSSSRVTRTDQGAAVVPPVHAIAITTTEDVLADRIGDRLARDGFQIGTERPDAYLAVTTVQAESGTPQSATATLTSSDGDIIASVAWENGWAFGRGSTVDQIVRSDADDAARAIAKKLTSILRSSATRPAADNEPSP